MQRLGRYTIVRSLAQGGMAEVFHARTEGPGGFEKDVALKRILPQLQTAEGAEGFAELFLDEARIAARLTHPNVVQVFDFGEADGSYYLAMELLNGIDLAAVLRTLRRSGASMPLDVAVHAIAEAAAGLHYAHTLTDGDGSPLRLVHRDVSPSNLFLTGHGEVKVLDFGIAKAEGQLHVTSAGTLKGKHAYVPPEQIRGLELTAQADIWALGLTLFELCTDVRFFQRPNPVATLQAILDEELPPLSQHRPEAPEALDAIIRRCVAKDLGERYTSCAVLRADLQDLLGTFAGRDMVASFVRYVGDLESGKNAAPPTLSTLGPSPRTPAPVFPAPQPTPPPFSPPQTPAEGETSGVLERGVRGTLDQLAIPDVVQMIEMGKRSAIVDVWPEGGEPGRLEFERGNVRYAAMGALSSDEAFFALCAAKQGSFHLVYEEPTGPINVSAPTSFLLLEAMRRLDEASTDYTPDDDPSLDLEVIQPGGFVEEGSPFALPANVQLDEPLENLPEADLAAMALVGAPAPEAPAAPSLSAADLISQHLEDERPIPTLKALLSRAGPLPSAAVVLVLRDVLRNIAAHFGDGRVAPSTVVIEGGRAALSSEHDDDDDARRAAYESPEEAAGQSLDMRSRLFSAATLAFELLTGESPFLRASAFATREAILQGPRPLVLERAGGAPVRLAEVIERMWRSAPEERPPSPAEALAALEPLALRIEALYPELLSRLLLEPERTARELAVEQARKDIELAAALALGGSEERRRAGFTLLRARAACPEDARAGARLLRMAQEEGWFLSGPPSSSVVALVEEAERAPYDVERLLALRQEAFDEGRFLHGAAALLRLHVLAPDDAELAHALSSLTGDPGAPFGLEELPSEAPTGAPVEDAPPLESANLARPSLPPVAPLTPPERAPTPATVPLALPPTTPAPFETAPSTAPPTLPDMEPPLAYEERPPTRRVAALVGVGCALALALASWFLWLSPASESGAESALALAAAPEERRPGLEARQRDALEEATALLFDGEPAEAVKALEAVIEMAPKSAVAIEARFALAQAHVRAGDTAAAADAYNAIRERTPEDDERHRRAQRLLEGLPAP